MSTEFAATMAQIIAVVVSISAVSLSVRVSTLAGLYDKYSQTKSSEYRRRVVFEYDNKLRGEELFHRMKAILHDLESNPPDETIRDEDKLAARTSLLVSALYFALILVQLLAFVGCMMKLQDVAAGWLTSPFFVGCSTLAGLAAVGCRPVGRLPWLDVPEKMSNKKLDQIFDELKKWEQAK